MGFWTIFIIIVAALIVVLKALDVIQMAIYARFITKNLNQLAELEEADEDVEVEE